MADGISGRTRVCGIFGCPVEHSFSPAMQNAAFKAAGLDYVYVPFLVRPGHLQAAVEAVRALDMAGVNVTIPHKETVLSFLDEISEEARLTGAVNTIVNRTGRLFGDNTDGKGFLRSLKENTGFTPAGKTALLIGAGGAARAVAVQLALAGLKKLFLANRSEGRARELAAFLAAQAGTEVEVIPWPKGESEVLPGRAVTESDLVVQATSLGMYPRQQETVPLPFELFGPGKVACDLVYNPVETLFLQKAGQAGATAVDGLGMLLYQGALAFELWTGIAAPVGAMREALVRLYPVKKNGS
ncbi:MAG: shikimate dehydrogenase [Pelotomaculum sp.]|uniref:Shikimate dehydrogenase (NADP(+)) n=1 Tax=Pelotomaculum thermopropionicum (strain DSM 13744 / JCM 10971 / SI) TaxID=370438 RepID=A5D371_PELTS|nr:shikimate dehydrogenase [Pelotomaculum sp.]BAF59310.1 shikimate 5-dehydrogenase [Pelotomaculum thermopropionicum SI]